ncbi:MAG: site-2 protease family protein [Sandaracinaceae bacterium]
MSEPERPAEDADDAPTGWREWRTPLILLALTFLSTFWVGAESYLAAQTKRSLLKSLTKTALDTAMDRDLGSGIAYFVAHPEAFARGASFAVPLMSILIAHEMGHYVAGKIHRVAISPPFFIPMPIFLLGTMGAVIRMRGAIRTRNALLDIGAAGPLAGMVVAIPVLIYGLSISRVATLDGLPAGVDYFVEGRSVLYLALLYAIKGPIESGADVWLSPTAMAGWAGLLVTQINLLPVAQLDGGHVAYALFGKKQDTYSRRVHKALPFVGAAVSLAYVIPSYLAGERGEALYGEAFAGMQWVVWAIVLTGLMRMSGADHPPTEPSELSRGRKVIAIGTLLLFVLLFMPSWMHQP